MPWFKYREMVCSSICLTFRISIPGVTLSIRHGDILASGNGSGEGRAKRAAAGAAAADSARLGAVFLDLERVAEPQDARRRAVDLEPGLLDRLE